MKNALLSTGTVKRVVAYCARSALGLSVITMIFALASWAILAVILSIEEYLGKLNIIRQSSLDMLQMWSMGLMAELLADSTFGTMCFKYSMNYSPKQDLPLEAATYLRLLDMIVSAASSNVAGAL